MHTLTQNEKVFWASMESFSSRLLPRCCAFLKDVNIEKMETSVNLFGLGDGGQEGAAPRKAICSQAKQVSMQLVETTGKDNPDEFS